MKQARRYYRIAEFTSQNFQIKTGIIQILLNPYDFRGANEDVRLDFTENFEIKIQFMERDGSKLGYWFVTGYEMNSAIAYERLNVYGKIMKEVYEFMKDREELVRSGVLKPEQQFELFEMGYVEVTPVNGHYYWYPKRLAPTSTGHKWIMMIDPKDVPAKKRPAATHTVLAPEFNMHNDVELTYLGFVYADSAEQAQQRVKERLVTYEGRPDLYAAYVKLNPVAVPKFELWPKLVEITK